MSSLGGRLRELTLADLGEGPGGPRPLLFILYFQNVFETLTLLFLASGIRPQCCMLYVLKNEVFIRGWGTRPPLSEFFGSVPGLDHIGSNFFLA